jgi:hypothetical protein
MEPAAGHLATEILQPAKAVISGWLDSLTSPGSVFGEGVTTTPSKAIASIRCLSLGHARNCGWKGR